MPPFAGLKIRGVNLVPPVGQTNPAVWGHAWGDRWEANWASWQAQIALAQDIGANCVRIIGGANTNIGNSDLATYVARQEQVAAYLADRGMYYYAGGAGDLSFPTDVAVIFQSTMPASVQALAAYPNVIAIDLFQEWDLWASLFASQAECVQSGLTPIYNAVKAVNETLPVTFSRVYPTAGALTDPIVDFHDQHLYVQEPDYAGNIDEILSWGKPVIFGEAGSIQNNSVPAREQFQVSVLGAVERSDVSGVCHWAMIDQTDGGAGVVRYGIYDENGENPRSGDIAYFASLPTSGPFDPPLAAGSARNSAGIGLRRGSRP